MNPSNGKGSVSTSSRVSWKSNEAPVADKFPVGLRVMVVDDDPTCLMILEKMLRTCKYEVKRCSRAEEALSILRGNSNGYDIVISDVHMPDMDGFKLLEHVGLEMDLPVIMMSADDSKSVVMKGVTHGACDYLIKPVRIEALKNIWQHVVRKRKNEWKEVDQQSGSADDGQQPKYSEDGDYSSSVNEGNWRNSKRRKDEDEDGEDRDDTSTLKKPRVVWSVELHQQFVGAVNQLGIDKAVPKKILELMNVPGLTRENVASHLQKYRLYLRRLSGVSPHQNNLGNSFMNPQDPGYGPLSTLNGIDLQTLAATGQLPAQSLATLQAAGLGRAVVAAKSRIPIPVVDQRNLFSFENPKLSFGDTQQPPQHLNNGGKQINMLHGIPTNMQPKQLVNLQHQGNSLPTVQNVQSVQSGSLLMQMTDQPPLRGQQPMGNYNSISQSSPMMNLSSSYPLPNIQAKSGFPEDLTSEMKGSTPGFMPSYDIFNELNHQQKSHDWELQNVGLTFNATQQANNSIDVLGTSIVASHHSGFSSSSQGSGLTRNASTVHANNNNNAISVGQHRMNINNFYPDNNPVRVKLEPPLFPEQFGQDDLMSALLRQQQGQGGIEPLENDFDFDGYSIDNIPV
ncbi:unnamed protein product [Linum trigynum]|uniref:Two-component response regulator n=1 Tax=Linum trigynum TaxID=586398 RepID=A0AAV2FHQ0_9ROSI